MSRAVRKYRSDERGGATVEFVIGLPLLFIAMAFVYEFSTLFWTHHIAANNVRSAVRYISRAPLAEPYLTQAENLARTGDPLDAAGDYDWMGGVTVTIDQSYDTFTDTDFRTGGQIIHIEVLVPYTFSTINLLNAFSGGALGDNLMLSVTDQGRYIGE